MQPKPIESIMLSNILSTHHDVFLKRLLYSRNMDIFISEILNPEWKWKQSSNILLSYFNNGATEWIFYKILSEKKNHFSKRRSLIHFSTWIFLVKFHFSSDFILSTRTLILPKYIYDGDSKLPFKDKCSDFLKGEHSGFLKSIRNILHFFSFLMDFPCEVHAKHELS